jgi:hypothetical protein
MSGSGDNFGLSETLRAASLGALVADERWGDAPVHTLGLALFLPKDDVHFFDEIGYRHDPFTPLPLRRASRKVCARDQPLSLRIESKDPTCLKHWIKNNWIRHETIRNLLG